jgi:hypothetical protein
LLVDRDRLRVGHVALAALPYLVGLSAWALYILQAPELFLAQFGGNAGGRLVSPSTFFEALGGSFGAAFGLTEHWAGPLVRLKALILLGYVTGVAGPAVVPALRREPGCRALLLVTVTYFLALSAFRSANGHDYLVHIVPLFAACVAAWGEWSWRSRALPRWVLATGTAGLVLLQTGGTAWRAAFDQYDDSYLPVVDFLRHDAAPGAIVMGSAEIGFDLGFEPRLIDDVRLGFHSGRRPDFIVIEERYTGWFEHLRQTEPATAAYIGELLTRESIKVYDRAPYVIYRMTSGSASRDTGDAAASRTGG